MDLYFVYLRQPQSLKDCRSDPFWEFGSFGKTGCHRTNLLHPLKSRLNEGDRLVFLQGGHHEIKVIGLTPPITVERGGEPLSVSWDRSYRPLPYVSAPLLVNNLGETGFPGVLGLFEDTNRTTYCEKAASRLRSRSTPIGPELREKILKWFSQESLPKISHYLEAIRAVESRLVQHGLSEGWESQQKRADRFAKFSGVCQRSTKPVPSTPCSATPSTGCRPKKLITRCG